ncbi:MAG: adenylate/guanylate cyclase domain-containing protein [Verrucomicrobiales bacterium]|nr:adenylate/guanylate cyclase domain-containing protein [Verrucomicrobiales bacterium]
MEEAINKAWLERDGGAAVPLQGTCTLGRSSANQVVVADEKASRRHAFIHGQGEDEWWLVDQGSSNGTYVNGRRVSLPTRLHHGDRLQIGDCGLVFHQPSKVGRTEHDSGVSVRTVIAIKARPCWLLLADIASSSKLAQDLPGEEVAHMVGGWFSKCREIIESHGGAINKYLGDGFFAYWPDTGQVQDAVRTGLEKLKILQDEGHPSFRLVLHYGKVTMGGTPTMGEESLSGSDVIFLFRMEKLAGGLGLPVMLSDVANRQLGVAQQTTAVGEHPLPGFSGEFSFFRW